MKRKHFSNHPVAELASLMLFGLFTLFESINRQ